MYYGIIYLLRNKINGKMYVGQTTVGLKHRMKVYLSRIKNPKCLIELKIKEYGWENFEKYILDVCYTNQSDLNILECFYIDKFNSKVENGCGYNVREGGSNGKLSELSKQKLKGPRPHIAGKNNPNFGNKYSKESREKISKNHANVSGNKNPMYGAKGKNNPNSKQIICLNTSIIYDSVVECASAMNLKASSVASVANGSRKSLFKFVFKYL